MHVASIAGTAFQRSSSLELAPLPTAVACARGHTTNVLAEWGLAHLSDDAVLLVSELMTNALEASAALPHTPAIALRLLASQTSLLIEAWDQSPLDLEPAEAGPGAEHGRGLLVVQALSTRWGTGRTGRDRKVVWCEIEAADRRT